MYEKCLIYVNNSLRLNFSFGENYLSFVVQKKPSARGGLMRMVVRDLKIVFNHKN
jgi:hypothetical protein